MEMIPKQSIVGLEGREKRTRAMLDDPLFLEKFCAHLGNGGDGPRYCLERGVRYSDVLGWISGGGEERRIAIGNAETAGAKWYIASIIGELRNIGMVDIGLAYDELGKLKALGDIPAEVRSAIVAVESDEIVEGGLVVGVTRRVKFSDKLKALELLGKHLQLFIDTTRIQHSVRVTLEDLIDRSYTKEVGGE